MAKMLIVKLSPRGSDKVLFERDVTINDSCPLDKFPFSKVIDTLDVLYSTIPHDVIFEISEL